MNASLCCEVSRNLQLEDWVILCYCLSLEVMQMSHRMEQLVLFWIPDLHVSWAAFRVVILAWTCDICWELPVEKWKEFIMKSHMRQELQRLLL